MQGQTGNQPRRQGANPDVLDDGSVHTRLISHDQQLCGLIQLVAEHENVEGEESQHLAVMQPPHDRGEILDPEVLGTLARIECIDTEIDSISPGGYRRLHGLPIPRGSQQLRDRQERRRVRRRAGSNCRNASAVPSKRQCQGS